MVCVCNDINTIQLQYKTTLFLPYAVKPLMFAAINVCVFTRRTISLTLKFAFLMRNIFLEGWVGTFRDY